MLKKFICKLIGHNYKFASIYEVLPLFKRKMWCARCDKDFTMDVKEEMELIRKEYNQMQASYRRKMGMTQ